LRDRIRANAEALAEANGVKIEFVRKKDFRKENRIQKILKERGEQPGLVHIFGAMEACSSYRPWHDKVTGKTYLKPDSSKCMTYYFYFMDQQLGLCYVRVPTWCPFRLQFYFNGHSWLANQLKERGIAYEMVDNAFVHIADYAVANKIANEFDVEILHLRLDELARQCCPVITDLSLHYHWSIMQAEYATDLVFKNREALQAFYPHLLETLTHVVKPADIATFLGRKLNGNYQGEMGNRFNKRWLGTRIKHQMGPLSIKMYDKFRFILRIEALIQSMQDGLILSDLKGTVVYANRRIGELADLTPEDLRGASIERVLTRVLSHASDPQRVRQEVENLLEGKSSKGVEFSFLNPGRTQYFRLDKFSVTDTRHVPIGRGLILRDITTDKELDRMKSSLVSTVLHELRTPLAAIKGYATTLLAEDVEWDRAAQREFLTIISDEADRLTLLVNNLLDLSRIEAGSLALSWEECRIEGLIQRAAAQAHLKAGSKFEVQIEAGLPKFYADRPRLETVLATCWRTPSNMAAATSPFRSASSGRASKSCFVYPMMAPASRLRRVSASSKVSIV